MSESMLSQLLDRFREDSGRYRNLAVPDDPESQRRALRSLMNIRMPRPLDGDTLRLQDEYLTRRAAEKGVVRMEDIPSARAQFGSRRPFSDILSLWQGDITRLSADAIVNAANDQMLGCFVPMHTCIDNCIHTFAGVQLRLECAQKMAALREKYGPDYAQPTAVPMLTDAYNLPAKKVIHVVGPIVTDRLTPELERDLSACYRNTLDLCRDNGLRSVAFCCISTGVFRFPNRRAAEIAVQTVRDWLQDHDGIEKVVFNVFKEIDLEIYDALLNQ